jgi:ABC-type lipoprotein export system ATPase subunit
MQADVNAEDTMLDGDEVDEALDDDEVVEDEAIAEAIDADVADEANDEQLESSGPVEYTVVAEGLSKHFQDGDEIIYAVDKVSFSCAPRQFVTIVGPSGCGKSTLLYLLGSLEQPTEGQLFVDGVEVTELPSGELNQFRRSRVGFVFQSFHLVPNLSALENVMLPMDVAGVPRAEQVARARGVLGQVGIDADRQHHRPGKLSGGQQQRVAIARALANNPAVILADEPTGNLDTRNSKRIVELLRELAKEGRTVIVVTHDLGIARQSDLQIELEDGQIRRMMTKEQRLQAQQAAAMKGPAPKAVTPRASSQKTSARRGARRG